MIPVWVYPLAAALVLAIGWRVSSRFRIRRRLVIALRSPREIDRQVGVRECVASGVTETAGMLIRLVRRETSRAVLDELLIALAERQWEPASKSAMVDLRLWARAYALEHPEVLVVTSHAAPAAAPVAAEPARPAAEPGAVEPARPAAVVEVAQATVLITPAGLTPALATIGELRRLGHRVIAADQDALSAGLRAADAGEVLPGPADPGFAVCLVQAIRRHGAAALICTAAAEQAALESAGLELTAAGVRWALPRITALHACADTSRLRAALRDSGLTVPATDPGEGARPFTADALMSAEGQLAGLVTQWRLETMGALSARAETFAGLGYQPDLTWALPEDSVSARVGAILASAIEELAAHRPDTVLVLGDTDTAPLVAMAARRQGIGVVHVEAGLRSFNGRSSEENNRRFMAAAATLNLAPTPLAAQFLRAEGVPAERIQVVGNPVIDVLPPHRAPMVRGIPARGSPHCSRHLTSGTSSRRGNAI